jgi:DNA-binding FrmR family transcriptional regulator
VEVEREELAAVLNRLRRAQGQLGGVIRMIEAGEDCRAVLTQLAACSRALDRAGFKIMTSGLKQCLLDQDSAEGAAASAALERAFLSLA